MINYILLSNSVLDLLNSYGISGAILMLSILIFYMMIRNSTRRNREQEEKIDFLYGKIDKLTSKEDKLDLHLPGKFISYAENANKIQIQLYHLLQNFGAERISIYEFHNGGKNLAGVEFKKCSNTYEAVSLEIKPIIKEMQNLPLSVNPLWSKILSTRDDIAISSVEKLEDTFLKAYLMSQSIKTYYATILQDYDNTPIGFITLEYYKHQIDLTEDQLEEFNEIAIKISVLINLK